ncbi:uncharacterized protein TRIVIDRAFT_67793 [Trichoderma virens Gv29-8]|uniref:Peptidase C45 acyl-coenzyme A:6-aminopenicillanic acid acyl-transferase n=1 Tax=Hypocrea virens (strain Gv29-8 / FGSC 10586) TaxID=413071 RepID=G9MN82_HYPVG|nr:uncharacterized protein TRIVIDRAFT_67793 [Trichoderma virens Gv29-8]EHK24174.1 hypothetical protein TRIVIDRAFT_67793 [Trichoderma virens Gv29-8]UKZ50479.1 hypothetical protein TrVGV298_004742 [Trichoderma virens]UKZ76824.1 hypothetical protein TrVFT333_004539 [Trichoderma virens FT-333]
MSPPSNYQHIVLKGLPYDRGHTHGEQARLKILDSLAHYHAPGKLLPWEMSLRIIKEVYLPGIERYFPEALPELQGIADGAGVDLDEILFLNARYDLARVRGSTIRPCPSSSNINSIRKAALNNHKGQNGADQIQNGVSVDDLSDIQELQECTTAGFLAESMHNGDIILAQNWDMSANVFLKDTAVYLEIYPDISEDLPAMFITTEAGQLGRSGFNSAGLGVCASSLMSTEDYFPLDLSLAPGIPQEPLLPMSLVRRQFLHNTNFANALINVKNAPRHLSNKLIVGTADNFVMSLEVTPSTIHLGYPSNGDNFVVGSNHFTSNSFQASQWNDRYPGGSSWFRAVRVAQRIRPLNNQELTEAKITEAFCDHLSLPSSVCQHMEDCTVKNVPDYPYKGAQTTLAHVRYNLTKRTTSVCKGPPCMGEFMEYSLPITSSLGKHEHRDIGVSYTLVNGKLKKL